MKIELSYKIIGDKGTAIHEATVSRAIDYFNARQSTILNRLDTVLDEMIKDERRNN